jgi:hypothetical protein
MASSDSEMAAAGDIRNEKRPPTEAASNATGHSSCSGESGVICFDLGNFQGLHEVLSQSVKGPVADDLMAKGIAEVRAKLN